jgi:hypothetical protein
MLLGLNEFVSRTGLPARAIFPVSPKVAADAQHRRHQQYEE